MKVERREMAQGATLQRVFCISDGPRFSHAKAFYQKVQKQIKVFFLKKVSSESSDLLAGLRQNPVN